MYLFLVKFLFRILFGSGITERNDTKRKDILRQTGIFTHHLHTCLLYTSDAADEL